MPCNVLVSQTSCHPHIYAGLPVRFNQSEVRVLENAGTVDVYVEVIPGNITNIDSADLNVTEDPNNGGCLQPGQ